MSQQINREDFIDSLRGKVYHDRSRQLTNRRLHFERGNRIDNVHNHPRFTNGARISTATAKASSSRAANPQQQQQKAEIVRKLRDLWADQTRLQKAVDTLVIRYRPTTSGVKRRAAEDYARQRLDQLTHGISTKFQQDRKLLETVLLTKQQRRDGRRRLLDNLQRKGVAAARKQYLDFKFKTGAADMKKKIVRWSSKKRRSSSREIIFGHQVQGRCCQY